MYEFFIDHYHGEEQRTKWGATTTKLRQSDLIDRAIPGSSSDIRFLGGDHCDLCSCMRDRRGICDMLQIAAPAAKMNRCDCLMALWLYDTYCHASGPGSAEKLANAAKGAWTCLFIVAKLQIVDTDNVESLERCISGAEAFGVSRKDLVETELVVLRGLSSKLSTESFPGRILETATCWLTRSNEYFLPGIEAIRLLWIFYSENCFYGYESRAVVAAVCKLVTGRFAAAKVISPVVNNFLLESQVGEVIEIFSKKTAPCENPIQ